MKNHKVDIKTPHQVDEQLCYNGVDVCLFVILRKLGLEYSFV